MELVYEGSEVSGMSPYKLISTKNLPEKWSLLGIPVEVVKDIQSPLGNFSLVNMITWEKRFTAKEAYETIKLQAMPLNTVLSKINFLMGIPHEIIYLGMKQPEKKGMPYKYYKVECITSLPEEFINKVKQIGLDLLNGGVSADLSMDMNIQQTPAPKKI